MRVVIRQQLVAEELVLDDGKELDFETRRQRVAASDGTQLRAQKRQQEYRVRQAWTAVLRHAGLRTNDRQTASASPSLEASVRANASFFCAISTLQCNRLKALAKRSARCLTGTARTIRARITHAH